MRIIAGEKRGRKLADFDGFDVRPTTDKVREAVFNIIQSYIPDACVLDLFSGSGALSFEALSRGAKYALCVDADRRSVNIIRKNAEATGYTGKCHIVNKSCFDVLKNLEQGFDIIFLDPPYNKGFIEPVLRDIVKYNALNPGGIAVLESDDTDFHKEAEGLTIFRSRKYGRTHITVYTRMEGQANESCGVSGKL